MRNRKEAMEERLGEKNMVIRYADMDGDGIWRRDLEMEREKRNRGNT